MSRMNALWRVLTLRCAEASRLSSEALDRPPSRLDRLALRLHLIGCGSCRRFGRQVVALRRISARLVGGAAGPAAEPLPEEARERIKRSLGGG